jgi:hypothetical protein
MTSKADFSEQEWETVLAGPPSAGVMVAMSASGGTFKESFAIAKAYAEARQQHGASELLDEIVSAKPEIDHHMYKSVDELNSTGVKHLQDAVAVLEQKATPEEVADFRAFVMTLSEKVAAAHKEDGVAISDPERAAMDQIQQAIGGQPG